MHFTSSTEERRTPKKQQQKLSHSNTKLGGHTDYDRKLKNSYGTMPAREHKIDHFASIVGSHLVGKLDPNISCKTQVSPIDQFTWMDGKSL